MLSVTSGRRDRTGAFQRVGLRMKEADMRGGAMSALKRVGAEAAIAVAAGVLSWVAAPPQGVLLHWSPEDTEPWRAPALGYAVVVPLIVFALGRPCHVCRDRRSLLGQSFG